MPLQRLGSAGAFIAEFANHSRRGRSEEGGTTTMRECGNGGAVQVLLRCCLEPDAAVGY
jgi:hypothetical protein